MCLSGSQIYAQPLYLAGVPLPGGGRHNVLFVATEHDSVYAFDADTGATLWKRTDFVDGQTRQPFPGNSDLQPEIGITGTPVIDPATGTLYVVVLTRENGGLMPSDFHQRLYALDCATGANKFAPGFPVEITATSLGTEGRPDRPDHVPPGSGEPALRTGPERRQGLRRMGVLPGPGALPRLGDRLRCQVRGCAGDIQRLAERRSGRRGHLAERRLTVG